MIRFTSTQLRPLLSRQHAALRPLLLEKNQGIYILIPDDLNPDGWLKAWAEGCNPSFDKDWAENAKRLIAEKEYSFQTFLAGRMIDAVLNEHHDLIMVPFKRADARETILTHTLPPEKTFLLVEDYRRNVQWLFDQSGRHFHACRNNSERLSWRNQTLYVLDIVIRLDCKRARSEDREMFDAAVRNVRNRVNHVNSDGSIRSF